MNETETITRLQGEAKVMLILLAKALEVLDTIDPDSATEHESLEELTDAIEAVLKARPIANKSAVDLLLDAADKPAAMKLERGRALVLTGPQGCGKSTLARKLAAAEGGFVEIGWRDFVSPYRDWADADIKTVIVDGLLTSEAALELIKWHVSCDKTIKPNDKTRRLEMIDMPNLIFCTSDPVSFDLIGWRRFWVVDVCAAGARGTGDGNCSKHPAAPHGFDRNGSHAAGRYVCECENWEPGEAS